MLEPLTSRRILLPLHAAGQQAHPQTVEPGRSEPVQHPSPFPLSARGISPTRNTYLVRTSLFPRRASLSPRHLASSEVLLSPRRSVAPFPTNLATNARHSISGIRAGSPTRYLISGSAPAASPTPLTNGYVRPASPCLVQRRRIPVDSQSTPRLQPGQVHSRSQEPLTLMHPLQGLVVQAPSPLASPGREAASMASRGTGGSGDDCLVRQLKALQEAKTMAAAKQAESDSMIAKRQDQLRRETRWQRWAFAVYFVGASQKLSGYRAS